MTLKVFIIILNWNRLSDTLECLNSCLKIDYPNYEIIVIDNGSDKNEARIIQEKYKNYPQIKSWRLNKNYGFAQGNNFVIEKILGNPEVRYIVCLNNDTVVEPNFLSELVKTAEKGFDMVNANVRSYNEHNEIDNLGMEVTRAMLTFNRKNKNSLLFCPTGCAVLLSRNLLEQTSTYSKDNSSDNSGKIREFFDPDYFCYAEDFDLGFRALLQGFKPALAEKAVVYHKGSRTTSIMSDLAVYHSYRNIVWTMIKNLPTPLFFRFLPKILIGHLAIIFLYFLRGKPTLILRAYFDAFKSLPKFLKKRKEIQKNKKISNQELLKYISRGIFSGDYKKYKILPLIKGD